jgi:RNA polymerase sigma-70 factor (ECF subfamily)
MNHGANRPPRKAGGLYLLRGSRSDEAFADGGNALLPALAAGDPHAALLTYEHYRPLARRLLRRILGPGGDLDDLEQEVFLRVFERASKVANPRAFTAYVMTVATRVAQSELRRRFVRRLVRFSQDGDLPEAPVSGADPAAREAVHRFYRVLDRLGGRDRSAFVLRFMEELDLTEVAAALGVSLATVKRRLDKVSERVSRLVAADPGLQEYVRGLQGGGR